MCKVCGQWILLKYIDLFLLQYPLSLTYVWWKFAIQIVISLIFVFFSSDTGFRLLVSTFLYCTVRSKKNAGHKISRFSPECRAECRVIDFHSVNSLSILVVRIVTNVDAVGYAGISCKTTRVRLLFSSRKNCKECGMPDSGSGCFDWLFRVSTLHQFFCSFSLMSTIRYCNVNYLLLQCQSLLS